MNKNKVRWRVILLSVFKSRLASSLICGNSLVGPGKFIKFIIIQHLKPLADTLGCFSTYPRRNGSEREKREAAPLVLTMSPLVPTMGLRTPA